VVALKVMAREIAGSAAARKRFSREAKAAAAVVHDHIVPIHAIEEASRVPYLVMQFIEGKSLQQKIDDEGSLELKEILRIGMQIASGLAAAHKQGLVHRDIKPANILLENGLQRVKITDFGLARAMDDASVSQSGVVAGTPQYMSPEQADGKPVDHRSDLFSLGSVLYAMCTGRPPFRAPSTVATLKRVCEDTPRPIRELNPDMPEWLCELVGKLHAKRPAERFQSAKEVTDLLEQHLAHVQRPNQVALPKRMERPLPQAEPPAAQARRSLMLPALLVGWPVLMLVLIITGIFRLVPPVVEDVVVLALLAVPTLVGLALFAMRFVRRPGRERPPAYSHLRWRLRWAWLAALVLLLLPGGVLFGPFVVRYLGNRSEAELVPVPGLVSLIVLQNDEPVTDWLSMRSGHTLTLSPGSYQLNAGTWPANRELSGWEVTRSRPFAEARELASGRSLKVTVQRGERVAIRARLRDVLPEPAPHPTQPRADPVLPPTAGVLTLQYEPGAYSEKIQRFGVVVQVRSRSGGISQLVLRRGEKTSTTFEPGEYTLEVNEPDEVELSRTKVKLAAKTEEEIAVRPKTGAPGIVPHRGHDSRP
jgi:hypothetical protein